LSVNEVLGIQKQPAGEQQASGEAAPEPVAVVAEPGGESKGPSEDAPREGSQDG
jgi:hypothetical protein